MTFLEKMIRDRAEIATDGPFSGQLCILGLRTSRPDGTSDGQDGRPFFQWPTEPGTLVRCAQWNPEPKCGNGIHYLPWGMGSMRMLTIHGDLSVLLYQVVRVPVATAVHVLEDGADAKWKSEAVELRYSGNQSGALEYLRAARVAVVLASYDGVTGPGAASSTGPRGAASSTGGQGAASSTGYHGAASSTGYQGAASSTGPRGAASSTGDHGAASSTGYQGAASSTGLRGAASSTGGQGAASSTGYHGAASSTGPRGAASSTGYQGAASSTGKWSLAYGERIAGGRESYIVCRYWDGARYRFKGANVDGKRVKPFRWYTTDGKKWIDGGEVEERLLPPDEIARRKEKK